jgi:hypothetical protein
MVFNRQTILKIVLAKLLLLAIVGALMWMFWPKPL